MIGLYNYLLIKYTESIVLKIARNLIGTQLPSVFPGNTISKNNEED